MKKIILYTNDCPRCEVLKEKLKESNIGFIECKDVYFMEQEGILNLPVLEVNQQRLGFKEAIDWINAVDADVITTAPSMEWLYWN